MRRFLQTVVAIMMLVAVAAVSPGVSPTYAYGAVPSPTTVILDGKTLSFDVLPVVEDGRTLVPLRAIFEALGATVHWDGSTQTVTAAKSGTVIRLTIGDKVARVGDRTVTLDVPGKIVVGRTLVPLRFVSESLGAKVHYDGATKTITITSGGKPYPANPEVVVKEYWAAFAAGNFDEAEKYLAKGLKITETIKRAWAGKGDPLESAVLKALVDGARLSTTGHQLLKDRSVVNVVVWPDLEALFTQLSVRMAKINEEAAAKGVKLSDNERGLLFLLALEDVLHETPESVFAVALVLENGRWKLEESPLPDPAVVFNLFN